MDKYFKILDNLIKYSKDNKYEETMLGRIKSYINGDITSIELIEGTNTYDRIYIYLAINKILNDTGNDIKYFIGKPISIFLDRMDVYLYATEVNTSDKLSKYSVECDLLKVRGPLDEYQIELEKHGINTHISDQHFNQGMIEVTGDLSNYPNGALLSGSDWKEILKRDPYFYERMYAIIRLDSYYGDSEYKDRQKTFEMDEIKSLINNRNKKYLRDKLLFEKIEMKKYPPDDESLPEDKIDKTRIRFISKKDAANLKIHAHIDYLTIEEALSGELCPFFELIERTKNDSLPKTSIDIEKDNQIKKILESNPHLTDYIDANNKTGNININELIEYLKSDLHRNMSRFIYGDIYKINQYPNYLSPAALLGSGKKRNILMLADFLLNYVGFQNIYDPNNQENVFKALTWFWKDPRVINAKICNIPLIEFARLNSPLMTEQFILYGNDILKTVDSPNKEDIMIIANLLIRSTSSKIALENDYPILEDFKEYYSNKRKL